MAAHTRFGERHAATWTRSASVMQKSSIGFGPQAMLRGQMCGGERKMGRTPSCRGVAPASKSKVQRRKAAKQRAMLRHLKQAWNGYHAAPNGRSLLDSDWNLLSGCDYGMVAGAACALKLWAPGGRLVEIQSPSRNTLKLLNEGNRGGVCLRSLKPEASLGIGPAACGEIETANQQHRAIGPQ